MQATNPPGVIWPGTGTAGSAAAADGTWSPWSVRKLLDELYRRRERNHANYLDLNWPKVAVYTVGRNGHAVRIDNSVGRAGQEELPSAWFHERYPHDTTAWRKFDLQRFHVESIPGPGMSAAHLPVETDAHTVTLGRPHAHAHAHSHSVLWEGATRGWVVGAVLLGLLVLIVRATEKCLDKRLFKRTRRESDEWPRPNVLATSQHLSSEIVLGSLPGMDEAAFPTDSNRTASTDLPPPYSECANNEASANGGANKIVISLEEPPPPYSACYVAYSNPKDGIPSVHFFNRRRQNLFDARQSESGPSSRSDTQNTPIVSGERCDTEITENGCVENAEGSNSELIFENGRIVERDACMNNVSVAFKAGSDTESELQAESSRSSSEPCHVVCIQDNVSSHERVLSA